jgi:hypothetical protein
MAEKKKYKYQAHVQAKAGTFLVGAVKRVTSTWFNTRAEAQSWICAMKNQPNYGTSAISKRAW